MTRSAAQNAAYRKLLPATDQHGVGEVFEDPALVGKELGFAPLMLVFRYEHSFYSLIDGILYHGGVVTAHGPGIGIALGSIWSWKAEELRVKP